MELAEIAQMEQQEKSYWWHVGRRLVLQRVLSSYLKPDGGLKVLDIGCGTGINYSWLKSWGDVTGLDSLREAVNYCRQSGAYDGLIVSDAVDIPAGPFDLITAFDVLEHFKDDKAALSKWCAALKPGGRLLLTVPAYQWMFSAHDKALHHFRRYSAYGLKRKLESASFRVLFISPFFCFTFPAVMVVRLLTKNSAPQTSYVKTTPLINTLLTNLSETEASILHQKIGLPWGSSIVAVAQKQ